MERKRRYTPQEKVKILLESFDRSTTATDICKKKQISNGVAQN